MTSYAYRAVNESGVTVSGTIEADSPDAADQALAARGLIPIKTAVKKGGPSLRFLNLFSGPLQRVRPETLIMFTTQFRTLIKAGVPMINLLQALEAQTEDVRLKRVIVAISQDVTEGLSLHEAFAKHPKVFSPLYCSMVRAGEASGALAEVLDRLNHILQHENKIRSDIRSALQYPALVVLMLVVAFFVLLTYVIPKFSNIFVRSGLELPLPTRICVAMYNALVQYWPIIGLTLVVVIIGIITYLRTDQGRFSKDRLLLTLPLVGPLYQKAAMARFASIFSILQASGVSVLDAMQILTETINNQAIAKEFDLISLRLEQGRGITGPLRQSQYFTPLVINMTAIGEESGNLEVMLSDIATHYDLELSYNLKRFSDSLGPMMTVGLAVVIGFFALAIYLPMWDLSQVVR